MPNFAARISEVARTRPGRIAVEQLHADGGTDSTSYGTLESHAGRIGGWLLESGLGSGDRAAILADNDAAWIAAYLGTLRIGAVAVPLDTAYKAGQVATVLSSAGAKVLFTTPKYLDTARAGAEGTSVRLALLSGSAADAAGAGALTAARAEPPVTDVPGDAMAVMLFTSGTTADPKGVVLTHANLDAEREGAFAIVRVTEDDAILGVLPLFHALAQMANLLLPLAVGARVVFLDTVNSTSLVSALGSRGITIFACVPQFFYLIHQKVTGEVRRKGPVARALVRAIIGLNVRLRDTFGINPARRIFRRIHQPLGAGMRLFVTGGSRFDPAIGRDLYGLGFTILNAYGLTETSGGATVVRPDDRFNESVGQPFPGVEIRILPPEPGDRDGADDGEVLIRGPIVMREYFNRPDATAEALRDGWLHTGDLGRLDDKGRLYITGRKKEIIVLASGKNLYPEEIETHYRQSPFIKELCVLGLSRPGEPSSERLHAVVVPDEDAMRARGVVNVRELLRFEIEGLSVHLPAHKRILSYDVSLEPIPRTTTGKIRRHEVQRRVRAREAAPVADDAPLSAPDVEWLHVEAHRTAIGTIARHLSRASVRPGANLELDLGLDSMERVELLTVLERQARTRVAAETRATLFTVRQLVEAVLAAAPATRAGDATGADAAEPAGDDAWEVLLAAPADAAVVENLGRRKAVTAVAMFLLVRGLMLAGRLVFRFRVTGRAHLPSSGPCILSPNHQAYLDAFFLAAALPYGTFRRMFFVGAAEYFETPFARWFARTINLVPVDPDANLTSAMQAGATGLRLGKALVLFPEGERSIDGTLKTFRKGAPILSAHLDAPIVPIALDGLFELWPRGRPFRWSLLRPWRRHEIRLEFGEPMRVERGRYAEGASALRSVVLRLLERQRSDSR